MADLMCVTQWQADVVVEDGAFGGSCTAGWGQRIDGKHDVTATVDSMFNAGNGGTAFEIPDCGAAKGVIKLYFNAGSYWTFTALCTGWTITADVSAGTEVTIQRRFGQCYQTGTDTDLTLSGPTVGPLASTGGKVNFV
jgi:hypothetical protein